MADERWWVAANIESICVVRAASEGEARMIAMLNNPDGDIDDFPLVSEVHPDIARQLDERGAENVLDETMRALRDVPVPFGYAANPASPEELADVAVLDFCRRMGI